MRIIRDDQGVGRETERLLAPYRAALMAQWEIERIADPDPALDLIFCIDTASHTIDVWPRVKLQPHPSVPAWRAFGEKDPRAVAWVYLTREKLSAGVLWPKIQENVS
jgi:hypothetical protein